MPRDFPVLQLNVNGLKNKAKELEALLTERDILLAVLQETKLGPKQKSPKFSNYTIVRKDRTTHGGGLAILVHHRLVFTERALVQVPGDAHLEMAVDVATKSGHLTVTKDGDTSDTLVLGDINEHDALWHSTRADARGTALSEEMLDSNYGVLNEDTPTRLPYAGEPTSTDVSLARSPRIVELNAQITDAIASEKRVQWQAHVESMDFRKDASRLWRTIKSLDGKPFNPPNGPFSSSGVQHTRADRLADLFNTQYTRVRPHDRDPLMRRTVRKVKRTPLEDAPQFTIVDVAAAIRRAKNSKAAGPDGITMLHLKHLGPLGLERLTDVINVSLACCSIPAIWKRSTIIPLPKAGKDPSQSTSYGQSPCCARQPRC
ncbi:hypothetical protein AAVH_12070 [Aphelenchoides avenae]|nr:hypothetical protein AAVH_12070 [Aphelenchus avenae]